ncbi:uncharacterized protein LOC143216896 [Lasioglossum baleicum]|uniref:uncharacterized protein LOC143216896 n=1 Tax=Lasioglossum baleicum TaxID=434251 RepID=UPI003FCD001E
MWQNYYNRMATKIQAAWRGYWVRKTVLNISAMRRWLETVYKKNGETVKNMNRFKYNEIRNRERSLELESMQWVLFILFKLHHLLRTKQRPGVVTRIDKSSFTFIEEMLKCFEYRKYTGFPYEKQEKMQRRKNRELKEAALHQQCEVVSRPTTRSGKRGKLENRPKENVELEDPCRMKELYDKIKNMDCQLDRFQLRCPVHATVLASQTTG